MKWYEVWSDESFDIPYILILGQFADKTEIIVMDPKDNAIVFQSSDYNKARLWLLEDEYTLVDGRMIEEMD